jgi:hypothetical protein
MIIKFLDVGLNFNPPFVDHFGLKHTSDHNCSSGLKKKMMTYF